MEKTWKFACLCLVASFLKLCNGFPIHFERTIADPHIQLLSGVLGVVVTICTLLLIAGCLCCQRGGGFKEFRDSPVAISTVGSVETGLVNPTSDGAFTIFAPLSRQGLSGTRERFRADEDYIYGDINVTSWFNEGERDFPRAKLKYIRELGKGWFGRVVEGTAQDLEGENTRTQVVVRILDSTAASKERVFFLHEADIYRCGEHTNILKLYGRCLDVVPFLLLQEFCPQGDLKSYLLSNRPNSDNMLASEYPLIWCCQLASAVKFLHEKGLAHPDLACRNCQLAANLTLKLGDYGLAASRYPEDYYEGAISVRWCAPESIRHTSTTIRSEQVTREANIWSLAVCFWEVCECAERPYEHLNDDEVVERVLGRECVRLPRPSRGVLYADYIYRLMQSCWLTPESRPTTTQIYLTLTDLLQVFTVCKAETEAGSITDSQESRESFDARWNSLKPNVLKTSDAAAETSDKANSKPTSPSLNNLIGSLEDMNRSRNSDEYNAHSVLLPNASDQKFEFKLGPQAKDPLETDSLNDSMIFTMRRSSSSETEEENWKRKIERGAYTEKVRQKSRSVADLMVLTHIDCSESESETPQPSLDHRVNYKNVRLAPRQKLDSAGYVHGSEGNLLSVQDDFQAELRKLQEEHRDSLFFVPDKFSRNAKGGEQINNNVEVDENKRLMESPDERLFMELNRSVTEVKPSNQVYNVFNVTIDNISPVHVVKFNEIINLEEPRESKMFVPYEVPKLRDIIRNNSNVGNLIGGSESPEEVSEEFITNESLHESYWQGDDGNVTSRGSSDERIFLEGELMKREDKLELGNSSVTSKAVLKLDGVSEETESGGVGSCCRSEPDGREDVIGEEALEGWGEKLCTLSGDRRRLNGEVSDEEKLDLKRLDLGDDESKSLEISHEECNGEIVETQGGIADVARDVIVTDLDECYERSEHNASEGDASEVEFKEEKGNMETQGKVAGVSRGEDGSKVEFKEEMVADVVREIIVADLDEGYERLQPNGDGSEVEFKKENGGVVELESSSSSFVPSESCVEVNSLGGNSSTDVAAEPISNGVTADSVDSDCFQDNSGNISSEIFNEFEVTILLVSDDSREKEIKDEEVSDAVEKLSKHIEELVDETEERASNSAIRRGECGDEISGDTGELLGSSGFEFLGEAAVDEMPIEIITVPDRLGENLPENYTNGGEDSMKFNKETEDHLNEAISPMENLANLGNIKEDDGVVLLTQFLDEEKKANEYLFAENKRKTIGVVQTKEFDDTDKKETSCQKKNEELKTPNKKKVYKVPKLIDMIENNDSLMDYIITNYESELHDDLSCDNSCNTNDTVIAKNETVNEDSDEFARSTSFPAVDFDLSDTQESTNPNPLTHVNAFANLRTKHKSLEFAASTPTKRARPSVVDGDVEAADLNYSLETWDNFLGRAIDSQNRSMGDQTFVFESLGAEPPSLMFVEGVVGKSATATPPNSDTDTSLVAEQLEGTVVLREGNDNLNGTYVTGEQRLNETYNAEEFNSTFTADLTEKQEGAPENWDTSGGWFLHPQSSTGVSGQLTEQKDKGSYVRFGMDDEILAALRGELLAKLPHAQGTSSDRVKENDDDWDPNERDEVFLRYNVYNTPLSPIPEESDNEADENSLCTTPGSPESGASDDWPEKFLDGAAVAGAQDADSQSLRAQGRHRHTPSQDSCCSNDTLFNLEEMTCAEQREDEEKADEKPTEADPMEERLRSEAINYFKYGTALGAGPGPESPLTDLESPMEQFPDKTYLMDFLVKEREHTESVSVVVVDVQSDSNSSKSSVPLITNMAPLPSPDDHPWKQLSASLLSLDRSQKKGFLDLDRKESDDSETQDSTYVNVNEDSCDSDKARLNEGFEKTEPNCENESGNKNYPSRVDEDGDGTNLDYDDARADNIHGENDSSCVNKSDANTDPDYYSLLVNEVDVDNDPDYESVLLNEGGGGNRPGYENVLVNEDGGDNYPYYENVLLHEGGGDNHPGNENVLVNDGDGDNHPGYENVLVNGRGGDNDPGYENVHVNEGDGDNSPGYDNVCVNEGGDDNGPGYEKVPVNVDSDDNRPVYENVSVKEICCESEPSYTNLSEKKESDRDSRDYVNGAAMNKVEVISDIYENLDNVGDVINEADYVNIANLENCKIHSEFVKEKIDIDSETYNPEYPIEVDDLVAREAKEGDAEGDDAIFGVLTDIRFSGPGGEPHLMSTSFSESNNEERDWDSGSDTRSSSSGEFIWKEGEHEESLKALQALPQDPLDDIGPKETNRDETSSEGSCSDEEGECPEFIPSAWDKYATPTKSALRSPEKTLEKEEKKKGVWFKKQRYHCVYEYPREPDSPVLQSFDLWNNAPPSTSYPDWYFDIDCGADFNEFSSSNYQDGDTLSTDFNAGFNDEFFVTSSATPFDMLSGSTSQFFPGDHWLDASKMTENTTPDSGVEDATPGSLERIDIAGIETQPASVPSLKFLAEVAHAKSNLAEKENRSSEILGGLRHTRDKLKLDLPTSPNTFTANKTFNLDNLEPPTEPIVLRERPTFTTFGKSRFLVQHVDTPDKDPVGKNVCFDALPYKPLETRATENRPKKIKKEEEKGEASLLDSADEDSGIESSTLERRSGNVTGKLIVDL